MSKRRSTFKKKEDKKFDTTKVKEVFNLLKDKLIQIIDNYELTVQKLKVKTDLGQK